MTSRESATGPRLYSIRTAARLLEISPDSVYRLLASGALKKVDVGTAKRSRLRIAADEMERFIAARTS